MSLDVILGQLMEGGRQLDLIPPNASREEQLVLINNAIIALNNFSRDVVAKSSVQVSVTGAAIETTIVPHNLGYTPRVFANLDQRSLQTDLVGGIAPLSNLPLPTGLSYTIGGGGVAILVWLEVFVDASNVYFRVLNSNSSTVVGGIPVKYFLTRDPAN